MRNYILDADKRPVAEPDVVKAAKFCEDNARVAKTRIDDIEVSTVFLGVDHRTTGGPPVLWETMIFGGEFDQHQWRYTSEADALDGHKRIVSQLAAGKAPTLDAPG